MLCTTTSLPFLFYYRVPATAWWRSIIYVVMYTYCLVFLVALTIQIALFYRYIYIYTTLLAIFSLVIQVKKRKKKEARKNRRGKITNSINNASNDLNGSKKRTKNETREKEKPKSETHQPQQWWHIMGGSGALCSRFFFLFPSFLKLCKFCRINVDVCVHICKCLRISSRIIFFFISSGCELKTTKKIKRRYKNYIKQEHQMIAWLKNNARKYQMRSRPIDDRVWRSKTLGRSFFFSVKNLGFSFRGWRRVQASASSFGNESIPPHFSFHVIISHSKLNSSLPDNGVRSLRVEWCSTF